MRRRRIGADSSLDLTPSNKHGTNFDDDDDDHVPPSHPPTLFLESGQKRREVFFKRAILNHIRTGGARFFDSSCVTDS